MDQHVENEQQHPTEHQQTPNTFGPTNNLTNNKEKSPMCLIHDLAHYNKIQYQYWRSGEQGPDHQKVFTITLKLGDEEYEAKGRSIKKAQHSAAAIALQQTKFNHRPPQRKRKNKSGRTPPTVVLNALAQKLHEEAVYVLEDGAHALQAQPVYYRRNNTYGSGEPHYNYHRRSTNSAQNYDARNENRYYGQKTHCHPPGEPFSIRLYVGEREYAGIGDTIQAARHDAASKAIEDIKQQEMDDNQQFPVVNENALPPTDTSNELNTKIKSPISSVYEIASKRNLNVIFKVLSEKGPAHRKVFITQCRVGDLTVEGEGNGKRISRKRAAEKMCKEFEKLGPLPNTTSLGAMKRNRAVNRKKRRRVANNKKPRNLIQVNSEQNSDYTEDINPVSHLTQIQQANKEKKPVYQVTERDAQRRRKASVNGNTSTDVGTIKKIPKRNNAEALLPTKGKLGSYEMLSSGSGSASTEDNKTGQVLKKSPQATQSVRAKDQLKTSYEKTALQAVNVLAQLRLDNVTANEESNTESASGESTAKPQAIPKAKPN